MMWLECLKRRNKLAQRGDTLVEVLICILLVSLILTGAYVTTNRSAVAVRDSQEHSEAMKLIQSQLEQVRQNAVSGNQAVFSQPGNAAFCMVSNAVIAASDGRCTQDSSGAQATNQPAYALAITRSDCTVASACNLFAIKATWERLGGNGTAMEQISYRLHK